MTKVLTNKQKRKRRNAILRLRAFLVLVLLLICLCVCLFTPILNIKTIEVAGNEQIKSEEIIKASGIPAKINLLKISEKKVEKALLRIPEIESVRLRRLLPPKVRIEVTETRPALIFPYMRGFAVTDINGKTMAHFEVADGLDLLKIEGLKLNSAEICQKITVQDNVTFDIIMETLQILQEKGLLSEMSAAHFENLADIYFYTKDGVKIIFGKTDEMAYKASMLASVLPQVNRTEGSYIDLSVPSRTVYGTLDSPQETQTPAEQSETQEGNETDTENNKDEAEPSEQKEVRSESTET